MEINERQKERRRLAIEKFANNRNQWPSPRQIGEVWNLWKWQGLWVGNSYERSQEIADECMFGIAQSETTDEEYEKEINDWIARLQAEQQERKLEKRVNLL